MYENSLTLNDNVLDKILGKSSKCPTPSPSSQAISKVYKLVNFNAGRNIDSNDTPIYNIEGVRRTLREFYKLSCAGWGYAPGTADEMTVVNAVAKNSGVDAAIVKVILYEWYYARKRQEIYDKPFPNANTSATESSTDTKTKPGKETDYKTPAEGGGTVIDRAKAFLSEPIVWGGALVGTALFIGWKYIPKKA
jgi:hypothetical protein